MNKKSFSVAFTELDQELATKEGYHRLTVSWQCHSEPGPGSWILCLEPQFHQVLSRLDSQEQPLKVKLINDCYVI